MTILKSDNYIVGFKLENGESLGEPYEKILANYPTPPEGFAYQLRADTLEWELVELPPIPEDNEEATAEDYEEALGRFGV